jgi:hypothetical protein
VQEECSIHASNVARVDGAAKPAAKKSKKAAK